MFNDEENNFDKVEKMPLFIKGKEILEVVQDILSFIQEEDEHLVYIKQIILEDAYMLTAKIVSAEAGDLYDLRMENAAIIRKAARDLMIQNHSLEMFGFEHVEYYSIVRTLLEDYRFLFIDWVAGFDKWNYSIDRWGLFNPPGVGPFNPEGEDDNRDDDF